MSRFSGPQSRGAVRELRTVRRTEAEQRQAAERERDAVRAAARQPERPLTIDEQLELLAAVAALNTRNVLSFLEQRARLPLEETR